MTIVDRDRIIKALDEQWDALVDLATALEPSEWDRPTACPGWSVKDVFSHVLGSEAMLLGQDPPDVTLPAHLPHVHNDLGRINEQWVVHYRDTPVTDLLADLGEVLIGRRAALVSMDQDAFDAEATTPAGADTYGRFMRIRVMDQWFHEQDVREAARRPGHLEGLAPDVTYEEVLATIGYGIGKKAAVRRGRSVRFVATGPLARRIDLAVEDRAEVVDDIGREPSVTIELPGEKLMRILGGRVSDGGAVELATEITGDRALGEQVLNGMAYVV